MKFGEALVLLMLVTCTIVSTVSATDYSAKETATENMLLDPEYNIPIKSVDVSISTEQVVFDCITDISVQETGAPLGQFGAFLGGVLGMYYLVVDSSPEVGDLTIIMKNKNQPTKLKMTCSKIWIKSLDMTNEDDANNLIYKVFLTAEKLE